MIPAALICIGAGLVFIPGLYVELNRVIRQRDAALVANMRLAERLRIAGIVTDHLAMDLADAVRPVTDWEPPVSPVTDTPVHDGVVVDLFREQLDGGQQA